MPWSSTLWHISIPMDQDTSWERSNRPPMFISHFFCSAGMVGSIGDVNSSQGVYVYVWSLNWVEEHSVHFWMMFNLLQAKALHEHAWALRDLLGWYNCMGLMLPYSHIYIYIYMYRYICQIYIYIYVYIFLHPPIILANFKDSKWSDENSG